MSQPWRDVVLGSALLASLLAPPTVEGQSGQTFAQLSDLGSNIGPRLTRSVARQRIGRDLFGRLGTKVTFIQGGLAYQLASDPVWNRVLAGLKDQYINEFNNSGGLGGRLIRPYGLDISARRWVYIADREARRVLVASFNPALKNIGSGGALNIALPGTRPIDVAWDGQTAPLVNDFVYVLDDSLSRVSYWQLNTWPGSQVWSYGSVGSGVGQFLRPTGVCVGKTPGGSGGTQFTTIFYVVDRGNKRVVRLGRNGNSVIWGLTVTQPNWDPADCAVDHFGQLYVTDAQGHRVFKFNSALWLLDSYGSYGTGPASLNTFASPGAISVPCGTKTVGTTTVWYCEGRIITAERWSDDTGALEHYLGVKAWFMSQPAAASEGSAFTSITTTEVANFSAKVHRQSVGIVRTLPGYLVGGGGGIGIHWDGKNDAGQPVPDGTYRFQITLLSPYGCPAGFAYPWCNMTMNGNYFSFHYCVPAGGGEPLSAPGGVGPTALPGPPVCGSSAIAALEGSAAGIPPVFAVRQIPGRVDRVPIGLSQLSTHPALRPSMSVAGEAIPVQRDLIMETREAGVTALQINLPSRETVRVRIVDLQGRLIRNDRIAETDPGALVYHWDGHDDQGRRVPPGVYIAQVDAGRQAARTKLIVTRVAD